jgi:hypothetical protein
MKIERIVVQGNPLNFDGDGDTEFSKRLERLDHLFRHQEQDPWMCKIKKFLARYFQIKIAQMTPEPEEEEGEEQES